MGPSELLALTIIGLVLTASLLAYRDVFHPGVLHASLWFLVMLAFAAYSESYNPISKMTYALVVLGVIAFSAGCCLSVHGSRPASQPIVVTHRYRGLSHALSFFFWVPLLVLPFFVARAYTLGTGGPTDNFLLNIRFSLTEDGASFGISAYGGLIAIVSAAIFLMHRSQIATWKLLVMIGTASIFALLFSGRTAIVMLIVVVLAILGVSRAVGAGTLAAIGGIATLVAFAAIGSLLGKGVVYEEGMAYLVDSMVITLRDYFLSPLAALDTLVRGEGQLTLGENAVRFFLAVLNRMGMDVGVPQLVQENVLVPMPTNVYTVYQPYLADFGMVFAVFIQAVFGFLHGASYRLAHKGSPTALLVYSLSLYPLIMQFFQDQYVNLMSTWIQIAILVWMYHWMVYGDGLKRVWNGIIAHSNC